MAIKHRNFLCTHTGEKGYKTVLGLKESTSFSNQKQNKLQGECKSDFVILMVKINNEILNSTNNTY